ncbi:MAG TPA: nucleotidyltransferase family protein [bacterium]|nr:nucleotidyltransferase family protein [bacterium]
MKNQNELKLIQIIRQQDWLVDALKAARNLQLPDWYIAAGAIRNTVWNYLHNLPTTSHQNDVDVVYFDGSDMQGKRERKSEKLLKSKYPNLKWEVVNQARAHLFGHSPNTKRPAAKSSCESIAYWTETPTCVGLRLENDDTFTICAPHGLDDLMNFVVQPPPKPYQDLALYQKRADSKKWDTFWPKLKIMRQ